MSLSQIGTSVRDLAGRAKSKKLAPSEMEGSTFTVSIPLDQTAKKNTNTTHLKDTENKNPALIS
jgi:pyruvate/2-oxoglutarate dehydrogenase complex dihydrolipoamide acyltransferase (E2) component